MCKRAIVRFPSAEFSKGTTTLKNEVTCYEKCVKQHNDLISLLNSLGLYVTILPSNPDFPDSGFINDNMLIIDTKCIILSMFNQSRKGEKQLISGFVNDNFTVIGDIEQPATIEGGDILRIANTFYIGVGNRTNIEGFTQIKSILNAEGFKVIKVNLSGNYHLKTQVSYIGKNIILAYGEMASAPEFSNFRKIILPKDEEFAANSFVAGGYVIVPKNAEKTINILRRNNILVKPVDISEFIKLNGGVSSLVVLF